MSTDCGLFPPYEHQITSEERLSPYSFIEFIEGVK